MHLKRYAEKMLDIADNLEGKGMGLFNLLPRASRNCYWATYKIYQGVGKKIRRNAHYGYRTSLSKLEKIRIILECMYSTSLNEHNKQK